MRNVRLEPRSRDLTALLAAGVPESVDTEKPKKGSAETADGWVKTSVSMRPETRRRLRTYAAQHDMRIQEVIEDALNAYL